MYLGNVLDPDNNDRRVIIYLALIDEGVHDRIRNQLRMTVTDLPKTLFNDFLNALF